MFYCAAVLKVRSQICFIFKLLMFNEWLILFVDLNLFLKHL